MSRHLFTNEIADFLDGWNHSGKVGSVNWFAGAMGLANGQRSLDYMKQIAEFINQPEYQNLILMYVATFEYGPHL
jgi:glucan 1,3-beta-glucosidase